MKERIRESINDPEKLEQLFQENKKAFESDFENIYSEIEGSELARFWKVRLDFSKRPVSIKRIDLNDILVTAIACIISAFLIKIPAFFNLNIGESVFYQKDGALIVFTGLIIYVAWVNRISDWKRISVIAAALFILALYINLLPPGQQIDTIILVYIHLPLLLWVIFGVVWISFDFADINKRISFIKYNGDLAIMAGLIMIAGSILAGLTIGLFEAIGLKIGEFYMNNVMIIGAACVLIVASFILRNYPTLISRIAPIISWIFSPLVLVTEVIYLVAIAFSGKSLYSDRFFLLLFNLMLLGVMAIIVFSVSEIPANTKERFNKTILFLLSLVTAVIDIIALSAIFYRLGTFGITPNRLAVLGSNLLILGNLVLIIIDFYKIIFRTGKIEKVSHTISKYLPLYIIWLLVVIFGFPLIFGIS